METPQFEEAYARLNSAQREAVDAIEGPVMVVAGPGTGKTQVLATRIGKIMKETQMRPENILCLTFTESGVTAMRDRLLELVGEDGYYVRISTFHSFCNEIINEHPEIFALGPDWRALNLFEKIEILRGCLDDLKGTSRLRPPGDPYMFVRDVEKDIKDLKQEGLSPDEFKEILDKVGKFARAVKGDMSGFVKLKPKERTAVVVSDWIEKTRAAARKAKLPEGMIGILENAARKYEEAVAVADGERELSKARTAIKDEVKKWYERMEKQEEKHQDLARVYAKYQAELARRGRYDYEDMVMMVVKELGRNDKLLAEYQEQYQYMLVDEFQDTNGAQNEVMRLWGSFFENPNIFVVGDDKQSIFRFQGASVANMLDFYRRYPEVRVVSLKENYRSQAYVLEAAAKVIQHNEESLVKYVPDVAADLEASSGRKPRELEWREYRTEADEDEGVARQIQELVQAGVKPAEVAVLFRKNRDGRKILKRLRELGVPVRLEAGEDALDATGIKEFLRMMEYVTNPVRDDLLAEVVRYPWWNLDAVEVVKVIRGAYTERKGLWEFMRGHEAFQAVTAQLADWHQRSAHTGAVQFWCEVLDESGWLKWALRQTDSLALVQKMNRVIEEATDLEKSGEKVSVAGFGEQLKLLGESGESLRVKQASMEENAVRLMTAHKAKGLEFEHVFIIRMNNRHWGNAQPMNKVPLPHGLVKYDFVMAGDNNEDERRLFYVALTRAKQGAYLSRPVFNLSDNQTSPSIFYAELPEEIVREQTVTETGEEKITVLTAALRPMLGRTEDEMRSWLREVVKREALSATHLNRYLSCPQEYYQRFIMRVPEAPAVNLGFGTAVHAALDFAVKERARTGKRTGTKQILEMFESVLRREIREEVNYQRMLELGVDMLRKYREYYQNEEELPAAGEWNMGRYGVRVEGVPVTGKIDKVELMDRADVLADGSWKKGARVRVVDYKTSDPVRGLVKSKPEGDYGRQLGFYKLLCELSPNFPYRVEEYVLDFIKPSSKDGRFVRHQVKITDTDTDKLKETIKQVWTEIQELKFLTEEGVSVCGDCWYCELAGVTRNR